MALRLIRLTYNTAGRLFPGYFGSKAYEQWFTTMRFKTPAYELPALDSARKETLEVNDLPISVYIWEDKNSKPDKTLLFVHGWTGRGTQIVNYINKLNAIGYRVISFDGPAHGNSPGEQTSALEMTDVVLALYKHYGKFDAAITHSFGGPCTAVAVQRGLKTKHIVSICPPATTTGLIEKFVSALHITEKTSAKLILRIKAKFGEHILKDTSMINTVKDIDIPGLVIHDAHDNDVTWEEGQAVAHAWNNAPFKITSGLGHRRILRDRDVIESAISFITA